MTRSAASCAGSLPHPDSSSEQGAGAALQGPGHRVSSTVRFDVCYACATRVADRESRALILSSRASALRRRLRADDLSRRVRARGTTRHGARLRDRERTHRRRHGAPLRSANVRVAGDRIAAVGLVRAAAGRAGRRRAAAWCSRRASSTSTTIRTTGSAKQPLAESQIAQGITTLVLGPGRRLAVAHRRRSSTQRRQQPGRAERRDDGRTRDRARARA